jgi:hypothetical protein
MVATLPARRTVAACALTAFTALGSAAAQIHDVVLSELVADGADRWIELQNTTAQSIDLSSWSLYQATHTGGMPQNYWWSFPPGTVIAASDFLRVHWLAAWQSPTTHELWTGDSFYYFLFGLGAEPLTAARGALSLMRSQQSAQMGSAAVLVDWVSWGEGGFVREDLAAQAGLWVLGHAAPAPRSNTSLARDTGRIGSAGDAENEWFVDSTPTPLAPNVAGALVEVIGQPCTVPGNHLLGAPALRPTSTPLLGNSAFGLRIDNTTGLMLETAVLVFAFAPAPADLPHLLPATTGAGCVELVDYRALAGALFVHTALFTTTVPLPLDTAPTGIIGLELWVQALVLDPAAGGYPPFQGATDALHLTIGG